MTTINLVGRRDSRTTKKAVNQVVRHQEAGELSGMALVVFVQGQPPWVTATGECRRDPYRALGALQELIYELVLQVKHKK